MVRFCLLTIVFACLVPLTASAHKVWLLPSQTTLSGNDPWVTVDAAVSNDLFYFNHVPLRLDNLQIIAPDGSPAEAQNQATGKYRSVFDLQLQQSGTYRIAVVNNGLFATWEVDGQRKRWRGNREAFASEVPQDAKDLKVTESVGRIETFVTNGVPNETALQPTGVGIEVVSLTHPNDQYAGEESRFRVLVDGEPAAGLAFEIVRGGTRYRNALDETTVTTDEKGEFAVTWAEPGMYWLETSKQDNKVQGTLASTRRLSYAATLEVLPQ
ncbi:Nickel uptake substrate-specific transmembrane region [Novipirellula galeiformis]|uniref:Nickel uptake substrate-specific transmembrane region n=1 Tax=Novipirellula galeiformis TaxID=2528004 RepID=A0A5C6CCQ2_9BACT|nr:DUF4198 domain-containing protein [Novipirellula galeiformis]TWU20619.1 Nickel uptake substrate-specific transmembrane region [Novipirellula galeiformis]